MARKFLTGIDLQSQRAVNVADPSSATDAANKQYVDAKVNGLEWKAHVRAATTTNGTLASAYANGSSIDGVTLATGDRILLKDQTTGSENGIYTVNASGAPTRATDADGAGELVANASVFVSEGTANADKAFTCTTNGAITVGTTSTAWAQVGGGGGTTYSAGNGLSLASTTFSVSPKASGGLIVDGTGVYLDTAIAARRYATAIGDGTSTTITVTHNLGTRDVVVAIYNATTYEVVDADVVNATTTTVTITFATAPTSAQYRAVVIG